jgi:type IV secretion system protein TrbE
MLSLREYRNKADRLADFLPWAALVAPGVVLNKDGSFQRSARFRGPDLDSATPAELIATTARLNSALRRLGSGWAIFVEAVRRPALDYPDSDFPDPASALIERERAAQFAEEGAHFESRYFLTLLWMPPAEDAARAERWLYEGKAEKGINPKELLVLFVDRTERLLRLIDGFVPEVAWLDDGETLTYLHNCVSTRSHRVRVPETPMHLDAVLADEPMTGGLEPRLGRAHLRTLTVVGFPSSTFPGLLDELNRLAFAYRWSTRAVMLDKTDATRLTAKIRRQWFAKRKSVASILKEVMTNEASTLLDSDASNKAADADAALQELGSDFVGQAYVTATVTVWDEDAALAAEKLRLVEKVIQGRDFTVIVEGMNAVEAWLGSLPGHVYANVRTPPISTLNLAHMIPLSAVWAGPERDDHFNAAPLFYARTEGSTPFRFSLHVGDVGHTLIVGPTGAGKSVLLALMALQFQRYDRAQVFAFDFGGSIRAAALACGGDWQDLGTSLSDDSAGAVLLQPLARIAQPAERNWAAEWLQAILTAEGVTIDPATKEHLWSALTSLATAPIAERTLTGLAVLLQSQALKQALAPYCIGGPFGRLLDAESEHLGQASFQAFETEGLTGSAAAPAVLSYLFHRIEGRLDGSNGSRRCARRMRAWCLRPRASPTSKARRSRLPSSRAALPASSSPTNVRSNHKYWRSIGASALMTDRSRSSRERRPSAIITASQRAATDCSNLALAKSRSPSPLPHQRPTSSRSMRSRACTAAPTLLRAGCAIAVWPGQPSCCPALRPFPSPFLGWTNPRSSAHETP